MNKIKINNKMQNNYKYFIIIIRLDYIIKVIIIISEDIY